MALKPRPDDRTEEELQAECDRMFEDIITLSSKWRSEGIHPGAMTARLMHAAVLTAIRLGIGKELLLTQVSDTYDRLADDEAN